MKATWKQAEKNLSDPRWRLNNLYRIITDKSEEIEFSFNAAQDVFYRNLWYWNLILKARQLGFTTLIDLIMLDWCLFNNNIQAGIIAHDLKSAQRIFYRKIQFVYEHLAPELRSRIPATKCDAMELRLKNDSSIWVGVSMRSATLRMLHISELGTICTKYPKKAVEIQTGSLPTLHEGSFLFVESTAEGPGGLFHDMAIDSRAITVEADKHKRPLNKQQMRFHFFPWFQHPTNRTNTEGISVSDELKHYFKDIQEKLSIKLSPEQCAWYALKKDGPAGFGRYMKRQHPSTPEEAFEQSVEGAIWGEEMELAYAQGRVGFYPWDKAAPVYTFWDLGYYNATAVIFAQFIREELRIIDYHEETGRGSSHHAMIVNRKPYNYKDASGSSTHWAPHDIMQHEKGSGTVLKDIYADKGIEFHVVDRPKLKAVSIEDARDIFNQVTFNAKTTEVLRSSLAFYRYEWDEEKAHFKKDPVHDKASDGADALQTMAMAYRYHITVGGRRIGYPHAIPANINAPRPKYNPLGHFSRRR